VSGDFIDYFKIDAQNIGFYIADVSGHGAAAAFITILLKSSISQMLADFKAGYQMSILQPHQVLALLNESLAKLNLGKYLTIVYAVLNIKTNKLRYSIGGHHPMPILCSEDSCEFLQGNGFAIGIMAPNSFNELVIQLPNAFNLILFSDGILEVLPQQGLKAQQAYLLDLMRLPNLAIEEIWDKTGIMRHDPLPDDIACLLLNKVSVHGKW
jgi:serine phosphatase RsbU (regulator of sigma subunit)